MKTSTSYSNKTYGNRENAVSYHVKIKNEGGKSGNITCEIIFDNPAEGRGIGYNVGNVQFVSFQLPAKVFLKMFQEVAKFTEGDQILRSEFHVQEDSRNPENTKIILDKKDTDKQDSI